MPYADRAFNGECAQIFGAFAAKGAEFRAPALAILRITVHLDAVNERTLFA
jgi:hypothetical protein